MIQLRSRTSSLVIWMRHLKGKLSWSCVEAVSLTEHISSRRAVLPNLHSSPCKRLERSSAIFLGLSLRPDSRAPWSSGSCCATLEVPVVNCFWCDNYPSVIRKRKRAQQLNQLSMRRPFEFPLLPGINHSHRESSLKVTRSRK